MSVRTHRAYERWASTYDTDPNPQILLEEPEVLEQVGAAADMMILDAGCGTGRYTAQFRQLGAEVIGVDFSHAMLGVARTRNPHIAFVEADLRRPLPFTENRFDRICCAQTLKHLPALGATIREFARVLRPEGVLVFSVTHPDMDWDGYEMRDEPEFILSREADIHHHRFTDYIAAINDAGLELDTVVPVPVSERIEHLLTPESYRRVRGRNQVVIFRARKAASSS
jgi:SAM-dependent methyltransferase